MIDPLAALGAPPTVGTRVYVSEVVAVDGHLCTVDPHDGDLVDQVPWVGQTPAVGDQVVMLLSQGQLVVLSMGRPTSGGVG